MRVGQKATRKVFIKQSVIDERCRGWDTNVVTVRFEVCKSGAFPYGNETCTHIVIEDPDGVRETAVDTRYWCDGLRAFANCYVCDKWGDNMEHYEIVLKGRDNIIMRR